MKIDFKETQYLMHQWENMLKAIPGLRTLAVKAAGEAILGEVQSQIKSKINDTHGHVAGAQMIDVGSGGGYAAVRPRADAIIAGKRYQNLPVSAKSFTRWLERGHGTRKASNPLYRHNDATGTYYVPGKLFYAWAALHADAVAFEAAEKVLDDFDAIFYGNHVVIPGVYEADEYIDG